MWYSNYINPLNASNPSKTSQLIYTANQLTNFDMRVTLALNGLIEDFLKNYLIKISTLIAVIWKWQDHIKDESQRWICFFQWIQLKPSILPYISFMAAFMLNLFGKNYWRNFRIILSCHHLHHRLLFLGWLMTQTKFITF